MHQTYVGMASRKGLILLARDSDDAVAVIRGAVAQQSGPVAAFWATLSSESVVRIRSELVQNQTLEALRRLDQLAVEIGPLSN